jgi:hypothetical protein
MLVTRQRRHILEAAMAARQEIVKRLPGALASPVDGHGAILSLGRRGRVLFSIRKRRKSLTLPLSSMDRLHIKVSTRSCIVVWWRK